jgi:ankyrin repeat protein
MLICEYNFPVSLIDYVEPPLGAACRRGHVGLCQVLLPELAASPDRGGRNYGDGIDSCRYWARISPLTVATQCRNYEIVKLLISHGAKTTVSAKTSGSPYPTESAIRNDDLDMLKLLVEEGARFPSCYNPISEIRFRRCGSDIIEFLVAATKQGSKWKAATSNGSRYRNWPPPSRRRQRFEYE